MIGAIAIRESSLVPLERTNDDGSVERVLFVRAFDEILVHPDRWEEFQLWVRQPDIADHPDVRALFRDVPR